MSSKIRNFNFIKSNNTTLQNNQGFQFAMRHSLNLYQKNAIYTFIPKNACTTMRASLAVANGFLDESELHNQINWVHNNTYSFSANTKDLITAEYTFTILRCPYERLASLFLDKFVDKTPVAWNFYRQSNNRFELGNLTFHQFIVHLNENPNILAGDIHWRRQSDFLIYQKYDDYFDFSNFEVIKRTLKKKIGLNTIDTRGLTNHGREKYVPAEHGLNYSNASCADILLLKMKGILPSTQQLLTQDIKIRINQLYKIDFTLIELNIK